ncbi:MAG: M20/M25/M40 family metallo-hydrolase, partial [Candidatus Marsarchaeota archaeon]|nr:M20/M25/M40 family metallo-hydrolase [Candidatus Marsarchaeota archaeon]
MPKDISSLFCNLVKIPSPSGKELEVARFISNYLRKSGIYHYTDRVGKTIGSNSGNLIAELKGEGPTIMFIAHIDTVETGNTPIKPVISDGTITSDGNTILGVDNKAAVAALMEALAEIKRKKTRPNIIAVFSVREEDGE